MILDTGQRGALAPTSRFLLQFSSPLGRPTKGDPGNVVPTRVYVSGAATCTLDPRHARLTMARNVHLAPDISMVKRQGQVHVSEPRSRSNVRDDSRRRPAPNLIRCAGPPCDLDRDVEHPPDLRRPRSEPPRPTHPARGGPRTPRPPVAVDPEPRPPDCLPTKVASGQKGAEA